MHKSPRWFRNLMQLLALSFLSTASAYATTLVYDNNNNVAGVNGLSFSDGGFLYTYNVSFVANSAYDIVYPAGNPPTFFNNPNGASLAAAALASVFNSFGVTQISGVTPYLGIGQMVAIPDNISQYGPYYGPDVYMASGSQSWIVDTFSVGPNIQNPPANWGALTVFAIVSAVAEQNWTSGAANTVTFSSPGQATVLSSLTVPANRSITLTESALATSPSNSAVTFTLYNSSGTAVGSFSSANSSSLTLAGLPAGTYSVLVTPAAGATGSVQLATSFVCLAYARADFNDDCESDILWRNTDGTVNIWSMNGTSISSSATVAAIPSTWTISGIGDFNGDGYADILWTNTDGTVNVWLMDAANIMSSATLGVVDTTWAVAGVGDFNGDGKADILWRNSNGDVVIWFMNGEAILSSADLGVIPTSWTVAGIGDFNDDGHADILWRNSNGDTVIWFMNGGTIESSTDFGVVPTTWSIAGTGDFNGDGTADILWRNSDGTVVAWLINSGTITSSSTLGVIPLSWAIARTGDFNGDGTSDILWRNSSGDTVIWLMSGGLISSSVDLGVIPTSWTIVPTGQ